MRNRLFKIWHVFLISICAVIFLMAGALLKGGADVMADKAVEKQVKIDGIEMMRVIGEIPIIKENKI